MIPKNPTLRKYKRDAQRAATDAFINPIRDYFNSGGSPTFQETRWTIETEDGVRYLKLVCPRCKITAKFKTLPVHEHCGYKETPPPEIAREFLNTSCK
jgi:phage FluMu protein Com